MLTVLILLFCNPHYSAENGNQSLIFFFYFALLPGIAFLQMIRKSNKITYYLSDVKLI